MKDLGAVFGSVYGWERPGWFAPKGYSLSEKDLDRPDVLLNHNHAPPTEDGRIVEKWSFRRSNLFRFVGEECRNVMENVGLQDMSAFAKMEVSGPGAREWLDSILANRIPKKDGPHRAVPSPDASAAGSGRNSRSMNGRRAASISSRPAPLSGTIMTRFTSCCPTDGSVKLNPITTRLGVLVLAGPNSRKVLQKLTDNRSLQRGLPVAFRPGDPRGPYQRACAARQFRRRTGLGVPSSRSSSRYALFDLLMEAGRNSASGPMASRRCRRCQSKRAIA